MIKVLGFLLLLVVALASCEFSSKAAFTISEADYDYEFTCTVKRVPRPPPTTQPTPPVTQPWPTPTTTLRPTPPPTNPWPTPTPTKRPTPTPPSSQPSPSPTAPSHPTPSSSQPWTTTTALPPPPIPTPPPNKEYIIVANQKYSWPAARTYCMNMRSQLLAIESEEETRYLIHLLNKNLLDEKDFWTSGYAFGKAGSWHWESGEDLAYNNWARNQPKNFESESCLRTVGPNLLWMAEDCSKAFNIICVKKSVQGRQHSYE